MWIRAVVLVLMVVVCQLNAQDDEDKIYFPGELAIFNVHKPIRKEKTASKHRFPRPVSI